MRGGCRGALIGRLNCLLPSGAQERRGGFGSKLVLQPLTANYQTQQLLESHVIFLFFFVPVKSNLVKKKDVFFFLSKPAKHKVFCRLVESSRHQVLHSVRHDAACRNSLAL